MTDRGRAQCGSGDFSGARTLWAERAARGLDYAELAPGLAYELGISGGLCGPPCCDPPFKAQD